MRASGDDNSEGVVFDSLKARKEKREKELSKRYLVQIERYNPNQRRWQWENRESYKRLWVARLFAYLELDDEKYRIIDTKVAARNGEES